MIRATLIVIAWVHAIPPAAAASRERVMIVLYQGFGTPKRAQLWGRVLEDKGFDLPNRDETWWRRVRHSVRLLESDEIPGADVELRVAGRTVKVKADSEGMFTVQLVGAIPVGEHPIAARLLAGGTQRTLANRVSIWPEATGSIERIAVVSDVDDTVLDSQVGRKARLAWRTLTSNAHRLRSFAGAARLFRRMRRCGYPLIFVSGSPQNLYPRLKHFFQLRRFPPAPILLKNLGVARGSDALRSQRRYKHKRLTQVRRLLPGYRLILIGDSGERDPEIYAEFRQRHPELVAAILIRRASPERASRPRLAGQFVFGHYREAVRYLESRDLLATR